MRALRLLHDLQIGDKNLLVKVDAKTKAQLDEWKAKKKTVNGVCACILLPQESIMRLTLFQISEYLPTS